MSDADLAGMLVLNRLEIRQHKIPVKQLMQTTSRGMIGSMSCVLLITGCSTVGGYPDNPENFSASMKISASSFDGTSESSYYAAKDDSARLALRNVIIQERLRGYDLEYAKFERQLLGRSNSFSVGTDMIGLALGGLTATVGGTATKAALGAASTGIVGANAAINKDLFYQKTIPALVTQMQADRAKALAPILTGMNRTDSKYGLVTALSDLNTYRDAGSIPSAISSVTQAAATEKQTAQNEISIIRGTADIPNLTDIKTLEPGINALTDTAVISLMKSVDSNLSKEPPAVQKGVATLDSSNARESNAAMARFIIKFWINTTTFTPDEFSLWQTSIANAK